MNKQKKKYWKGQYVGVRLACGNTTHMVCRIVEVYEPGKIGPFCKRDTYTEIYINNNSDYTFWLDGGWITVPEIFFNSKKEADLWLLKKQVINLKKDLKRERSRNKKLSKNFMKLKNCIRKLA